MCGKVYADEATYSRLAQFCIGKKIIKMIASL